MLERLCARPGLAETAIHRLIGSEGERTPLLALATRDVGSLARIRGSVVTIRLVLADVESWRPRHGVIDWLTRLRKEAAPAQPQLEAMNLRQTHETLLRVSQSFAIIDGFEDLERADFSKGVEKEKPVLGHAPISQQDSGGEREAAYRFYAFKEERDLRPPELKRSGEQSRVSIAFVSGRCPGEPSFVTAVFPG